MAQKFHNPMGEKDHLSPKLQRASRESTKGKIGIFIPELRMTVFVKNSGSKEKIKEKIMEKYMARTLYYKKPIK